MTRLLAILLLIGYLAIGTVAHEEHELKLGSFCNPISGCRNSSLTCLKNRCECAPGFKKSKHDDDQCLEVGCKADKDCNQLDPGRKCYNGSCSRCKAGLILDSDANRCISRLGHACRRTRDCLPGDTDYTDDKEMPICRIGRCVCRANYYPNADWSKCEPRPCSSQDDCNFFSDDPNRYCSKSRRHCLCKVDYYEDAARSLCLPLIPLQYSLMMPLWLAMIMFTICLLVYISRRLTTGRIVASEEGSSEPSVPIPYTLNRPPPSYETVVKEPAAEVQPPSFINRASTSN